MIYSKSKDELSKSIEQHNSGKLYNVNWIKPMNHILILSRSEEETLKLNARYNHNNHSHRKIDH